MSTSEQINAIRALRNLYDSAVRRSLPIQSSVVFTQEQLTDVLRAEADPQRVELLRNQQSRFMREIEDARKALLASGFDVPHSWLAVRFIGARSTGTSYGPLGTIKYTVTDPGADVAELERVRREMYAAILRLQVEQERENPPPEPVEPMTQTEFRDWFQREASALLPKPIPKPSDTPVGTWAKKIGRTLANQHDTYKPNEIEKMLKALAKYDATSDDKKTSKYAEAARALLNHFFPRARQA